MLRAAAALLMAGWIAPAAMAKGQDSVPLEVGTMAPDFALVSATSNGVLAEPIRLGDFRDQTVVIAFFYRARTKG